MQRTLLFVASPLLASLASAQTHLDWLSVHDGPQSQADYGRCCAVDASGNVYVAGRSYNPSVGIPPLPPSADIELVKYSPAGVELWSARKDVFGDEDMALDVQVASTGDVYVCGYGWNGNDIDSALLKYSSAGAFQWMTNHTSVGGTDFARAIAFDASGNVLVCGNAYGATSNTDVMVESYTPAGGLNWSTVFDGGANGADTAYALAVLPSGQIAVSGQLTSASGGGDFAVWILSSGGALQKAIASDGGAHLTDAAFCVAPGASGKVLAGGYRTTASSGTDWMVAQADIASSTFDWTAFHDGTAHSSDTVRSIALDSSGVAWACGGTTNTGTGIDFLTKRFDAAGSVLSSATWNNTLANLDDSPFKLLLGAAGQVWVCGYSTKSSSPVNNDAALVQYDASGAFDWAVTYSTAGAFDDRPFDAEIAPNARIALAGYTNGGASGDYDYLALQVDVNDSPQAYCTAKTTSTGCVPSTSFTGMPSASASSGFVVRCVQARNQKNGLLFYGVNGSASLPFQGGTMCVAPPQVRTPIQSSGGSALPADDCSGSFALDMNAFASGALGGSPLPALLVPGTAVCCQFWGRDPGFAPPQNTQLSNALHYVVLP